MSLVFFSSRLWKRIFYFIFGLGCYLQGIHQVFGDDFRLTDVPTKPKEKWIEINSHCPHKRRQHQIQFPNDSPSLPCDLFQSDVGLEAEASLGKNTSIVDPSFQEIPEDPRPAHLARNSHFLVSNENHHDRFYETLSKKKGDVYIGVGTEQNYLLSGWSRPDVMVLMDFDEMVVDLHRVYRLMFLHAQTPEDFLALWKTNAKLRRQIESWIVEEYGAWILNPNGSGEPNRVQVCDRKCRAVLNAYHAALVHQIVEHRLAWIRKEYTRRNLPTFLNDQAQYQWIRERFQKKQVVLLRGDLSKHCLASIAEVLTKRHQKLGTLYLSNAERYFSYLPNFKLAAESLPVAPNSIILHTWALKNRGNKYAYFVQKADGFISWLRRPEVTTVRAILRPYLRGLRAGKFGRFPQPVFMIEN